MKTVRLRSIAGRCFRTFVEPFRVDLPATGMILVRGINGDTGGGSGAGKSNLGLAAGYALGYGWVPATALKAWDADGEMSVEVGIEVDGAPHVVVRGPGRVEVDGARGVAVKQAEEGLRALLGAPAGVLGPLVHRRQREHGAFLSLADDEARELLAGPLGLDSLDGAADDAAARAKALGDQLATARDARVRQEGVLAGMPAVDLDALQAQFDDAAALATEADRQGIAATQGYRSLFRQDVADREAERTALEAEEGRLWARLDVLKQEHARPVELPPALVAEAGRLLQLKQGLVKRQAAADAAENLRRMQRQEGRAVVERLRDLAVGARARVPGLVADLARLEDEHKSLQVGNCPTCHRAWPEHVAAQRVALAKRRETVGAELAGANTLAAAAPDLRAWDAAHPDEPTPLLARCQEAREALGRMCAELEERTAQVTEAYRHARQERAVEAETVRAALAAAAARRAALDRPRDGSGTPLGDAMALVTRYEKQHLQATGARAAAGESLEAGRRTARRRAEAEAEAARLRGVEEDVAQRAIAERDFELFLRTFLGKSVAESLDEVAREVNALLAGVANVRHLVFALRTDKTAKKGTTRTAITPVVGVRGRELVGRREIKDGISGGQAAALELAVDLGVLRVVERQLGVRWAFLFLDEPFDGLGAVEKETALEMLRHITRDRLALVVDHETSTQGLFEQELVVRYAAGRSSLA